MIKFYDDTHMYLNPDNVSYRSVTSILKKLEPKKDWDKITKAYAKKNNLTVEEVKAMWKLEKDNSIIRGKKAHTMLEAESLSQAVMIIEDKGEIPVFAPQYEDTVKVSPTMKLTDGVYPEVILWLDSYKLAGQADRIEIIDNTINVYDYKTNKKIEKQGFTNYMGETEKLVYPCGHLDNCNFNIYSLQLNMYAYMIKRHNPKMKIGKMEIIHLLFENPDNQEEITSRVIYEVPDLQKEIGNILKAIEQGKI